MRFAALTFCGSLALAAAPVAAIAAPVAPVISAPAHSHVIEAAWGCGPAYHPNGWGYCVPNVYYAYPVWGGYWYGGYRHGWGGHWGRWHH